MGNHESWRPVAEFIESHKMKHRKCETYFAKFSKFKILDNQNFSGFSEHVFSLEKIVMESLIPQKNPYLR